MDFDALVLGTGLSESITAAALSKAGYKVAHVDTNQYYGGDEASLTLEELAEWADARAQNKERGDEGASSDYLVHQRTRYISVSRSPDLPPHSRQYSVSLAPSIVPSLGSHINSLIASGVSRYGSFKLLEQVALYDRPGFVQTVPGSKEDVFKSKQLSLLDKRRLMRFLMFAAGDFEGKKELEGREQTSFVQFLQDVFSLKDKAASAIAYALAFCVSPEEPTLPALQRIRQYLRSAGRYGASPFLVGHYGGLGETAQGFCRTSAVKGGLYVLGRHVLSVSPPSSTPTKDLENCGTTVAEPRYTVELQDFAERLTGRVLIASPDYLPPSLLSATDSTARSSFSIARCIAVIDKPMVFLPSEAQEDDADVEDPIEEGVEGEPSSRPTKPDHQIDTAVLVFPPGALPNGSSTAAAHVLITGPASMSTPKGTWILHFSLPLPTPPVPERSAEDVLWPYVDAALTLTVPPGTTPSKPLFTVFYLHHPISPRANAAGNNAIVTPPYTQLLPALSDMATENAQSMFWKAVEQLKAEGVQRRPTSEVYAHGKSKGADETEEELGEVDSFWPPLDAMEESEVTDDW